MRTPAPLCSPQWQFRRLLATAVAAVTAWLTVGPPAAADEAFPVATQAPQVTSAPASPDNDLAPRWEFNAQEIATFECSLTRDDTLVGDWAPCVSPMAYDLSSHPDGAYTFAVRARGADGSTSDIATSAYTLDTSIPPLPTIVSLPGPAAADRSPEWTFAGGEGGTFECGLNRGSKVIAAWSPCTSPHEFDLSAEPDGAYTFSVRGVADTGARGPVRTSAYRLDTVAPAAPEISSAPAEIGNRQSAQLAFSAEAGAQVECRATADEIDTPGWAPCESPFTYDLEGRPDAGYKLALRATDAAGNTSAEAAVNYTLDTTPPAAPAVDPPAVEPATKLQPSFSFAGNTVDTYECRLDGPGGYATGWQPCTSPAPYDLAGQPDGAYSFSVRGTDTAGNVGEPGTASYDLARDPEAVDLQAGPGRTGRTRYPRWSFKVAGGSGFVCSLERDAVTVFTPSTCGSPRAYDLSGKPDGTYTFKVRAAGREGSEHEPAIHEYELDSTAPPRPAVEAAPVSPAANETPAWRFSGEGGAALDCRVTRGPATVVGWTSCTNHKQFDLGGADDGGYRVTVRARDAAGNVSASTTSHYELDSTPPAAPIVRSAPKVDDIDRSPTWTFSGESGARFSCTLRRGDEVVAPKTPCATTQTYNLSGAEPGTYKFAVQATDEAGNVGSPKVVSYVLAAAPMLNRTGPSGGDAGSGAGTSTGTDGGTADQGATPATPDTPPTGDSDPTEPSATGGSRTPTTSGDRATPAGGQIARNGSPAARRDAANQAGGARGSGNNGTTASSATAAGDRQDVGRGVTETVKEAVDRAAREATGAITSDVGKTVFPISILLIIAGFLLVQNRIDRSEPKLAAAPIDGDPDLEFGPPPTRR